MTRTQIHAECDNPLDASSGSYTTRVLLGRRDDEILEVYARTLVEQWSKCPLRTARARPLRLLRARLAALGGRPTGRPATASTLAESTAL